MSNRVDLHMHVLWTVCMYVPIITLLRARFATNTRACVDKKHLQSFTQLVISSNTTTTTNNNNNNYNNNYNGISNDH